ncbi:isochorismatase family protein [Comamonas piscis]|uniref:Isochorismatase family protein n=1 Tax=Comamonas piscis TaxID=1562974 RepID=A0A7G5EM77_9BURK|nr:isochorismatase family protein [Comamonas piscis]QMV75102.1 isochorismatase family protein [Comamonas piscis]WSO33587.1 isochorismatase family protein [Comamonas piscis]
MTASKALLTPDNCALVLIDQQAGLAFGVQSISQQTMLNNAVALARTAVAFDLPVVISTSATKVYSGPLMPALRNVLPQHEILDRRNMNVFEDAAVDAAILATGRKKLLFSGMFTEACISFAALSAQESGYESLVVTDACGGLSENGHEMALRRMQGHGVQMTSWLQVLLELQRDWTRKSTYDAARAIVESNGDGYGIGLNYARDML